MTIWQRIAREPNALTGIVIALYGVLVAFHVLVISPEQTGALAALGGALVFGLRWIVTPASEVVAQKRPDSDVATAGPAATAPTGAPVKVEERETFIGRDGLTYYVDDPAGPPAP
jgi:hypothetical protein